MSSIESFPVQEQDPRLQSILEKYGDILVLDHKNQPARLRQATDPTSPNYCPPFINVLLGAGSPEEIEQIVSALKAPE